MLFAGINCEEFCVEIAGYFIVRFLVRKQVLSGVIRRGFGDAIYARAVCITHIATDDGRRSISFPYLFCLL